MGFSYRKKPEDDLVIEFNKGLSMSDGEKKKPLSAAEKKVLLAKLLKKKAAAKKAQQKKQHKVQQAPASFAQDRMWFLMQFAKVGGIQHPYANSINRKY